MWIKFNNAFLSILENRDNKQELLVRARINGLAEARAETREAHLPVMPGDVADNPAGLLRHDLVALALRGQ